MNEDTINYKELEKFIFHYLDNFFENEEIGYEEFSKRLEEKYKDISTRGLSVEEFFKEEILEEYLAQTSNKRNSQTSLNCVDDIKLSL